jgi:hypothetical protein
MMLIDFTPMSNGVHDNGLFGSEDFKNNAVRTFTQFVQTA